MINHTSPETLRTKEVLSAVLDNASKPAGIALILLVLTVYIAPLKADPTLPTFGSSVFNVTISNPNIDGGLTMSPSNSDVLNTSVLQAYINYCSSNTVGGKGGIVEIPAGTYYSDTVDMNKNVNLQIDTGAVLADYNYSNTLITTVSSNLTNVEISGGGIIEGSDTTSHTAGSVLVILNKCIDVEVTNVSIQDAGNEHLNVEYDTNLTISGVTIADPGTLAGNHGAYLANTDGIDFRGSNILIKGCNINDGDDDICAKPDSRFCSQIVISNCIIGAGHGISIGGGFASGISNMLVTDCTFNGTTNGIRIKAGQTTNASAGGGLSHPAIDITYNNLTMNNVSNPIVIESTYNGGDNFPNTPTNATYYTASPTAILTNTPVFENITFENIQCSNCGNAGLIEGLNTAPANLFGVTFSNVNISASQQMNLWYASNVNISGLTVTVPTNNAFYSPNSTTNGIWAYGLTDVTYPAPEPSTYALLVLAVLTLVIVCRKKVS